ncbi:MAG: hypothetical protein ACLS9J_07580, partial [Ruminococcus sp.]
SGDKLHGVVVVPFFTTIFKEEAKSLAVPNITIKLPNGQTLATSATKGFATGAKSTVSSIVKATATATVKTKVIAVVCGATILAGTSAVGISILAGCNAEKEPTEPSVISSTVQTSTVQTSTVSSEVSKAIEDNGLKIDKDGNITDKKGKKVEVKDGKVEVKTDDGKTVTVKVDDVKTTVSNNNNGNKGNTEKKENTKSNTSKTDTSKNDTKKDDQKPTQKPVSKPSDSSKVQPATKDPHEGKTYHEAVYKYYKRHDAVTKYHEKEWIVTGTHEEPVYETRWVNVCNDCGVQLADANFRREHLLWEADNGGRGSYHAEEQQVQVGTKTVEDGYWKEAYTETIKKAYDEEVSANDNWDKKVLVRKAGWY